MFASAVKVYRKASLKQKNVGISSVSYVHFLLPSASPKIVQEKFYKNCRESFPCLIIVM